MQDEEEKPHLPPVPDPLLERVKNTFLAEYFPLHNWCTGAIFMSTQDIYEKLQRIYPTDSYTPGDIATWLHHAGYTFFNAGEMRFEWMLKPST